MVAAAPRLDRKLLEALEKAERSGGSVAAIRRCLVRRALEIGAPPPSYEHVRRLVLALRKTRLADGPSVGRIAVDISFRARPVAALVERVLDELDA